MVHRESNPHTRTDALQEDGQRRREVISLDVISEAYLAIPGPYEAVDEQTLDEALDQLEPRQRQVIEMRLGDDQPKAPWHIIASTIRASTTRAQQIALEGLRQIAASRTPAEMEIFPRPTSTRQRRLIAIDKTITQHIERTVPAGIVDSEPIRRINQETDQSIGSLATFIYSGLNGHEPMTLHKHRLLENLEADLRLLPTQHINYAHYVQALRALARHGLIQLTHNDRGTVIKSVLWLGYEPS